VGDVFAAGGSPSLEKKKGRGESLLQRGPQELEQKSHPEKEQNKPKKQRSETWGGDGGISYPLQWPDARGRKEKVREEDGDKKTRPFLFLA